MKFLIQKIDGEVRHDFAFTLLESIRYQKWLNPDEKITVKYLNTTEDMVGWALIFRLFKGVHSKYIPIGSVEFVTAFFFRFYNFLPKPVNVPEELFPYTNRAIFNGDQDAIEIHKDLKLFIKSNDRIKKKPEIYLPENYPWSLPMGRYQYSEFIQIDSEWRAFVFKGELVGLQNYSGDFTMFPNPHAIKRMIYAYKDAPVAYTLDIGVQVNNGNEYTTFVIEVHDFFSCGLYGFADHKILPQMNSQWFHQYLQRKMVEEYGKNRNL